MRYEAKSFLTFDAADDAAAHDQMRYLEGEIDNLLASLPHQPGDRAEFAIEDSQPERVE